MQNQTAETVPADLISPSNNAYNAHEWPDNMDCWSHSTKQQTRALCGASAIVKLLHIDDELIRERADSDEPQREPEPFSQYIREGLWQALNTCLHELHRLNEDAASVDEAVAKQ